MNPPGPPSKHHKTGAAKQAGLPDDAWLRHNSWVLERFEHRLVADIADHGPMQFGRFVEAALYDPDFGFYATSGRAGGRQGDFVTSVEAGPLFASVIADWLDGVWRSLGQPADFRVTEVGAGVGTLFRGVHKAAPDCLAALTYTLVERSAAMQVAHLSLPGEMWRSSGEVPKARQHVIVANELLDNLGFDIAERVVGGWACVRVGTDGERLRFVVGPVATELAYLSELAPDAGVGTRVPIAVHGRTWVEEVTANADRVLAFDYGATTAELAARNFGWLRTYAGHARGNDPLVDAGRRDITHDVPLDQLPEPSLQLAQADWLHANGLAARLAAARKTWEERGGVGDLAAMAARSAIGESEALTDPAGLGAFVALEWHT